MSLTDDMKTKMRLGRERALAAKKALKADESPVLTMTEDELTRRIEAAAQSAAERVGSSKNETADAVKAVLESQERLRPTENRVAPHISVFNPLGETDHPKDKLKCEVTQCGFPAESKVMLPSEVNALNEFIDQVETRYRNQEPLVYEIHRVDGTQGKVTLDCAWSHHGTLESLGINYPVKTIDLRSGLYSFTTMLNQMMGKAAPEMDTAALIARNHDLEAELARLRAS